MQRLDLPEVLSVLKGGEANFSFCDFEPIFLHEFLPKS